MVSISHTQLKFLNRFDTDNELTLLQKCALAYKSTLFYHPKLCRDCRSSNKAVCNQHTDRPFSLVTGVMIFMERKILRWLSWHNTKIRCLIRPMLCFLLPLLINTHNNQGKKLSVCKIRHILYIDTIHYNAIECFKFMFWCFCTGTRQAIAGVLCSSEAAITGWVGRAIRASLCTRRWWYVDVIVHKVTAIYLMSAEKSLQSTSINKCKKNNHWILCST